MSLILAGALAMSQVLPFIDRSELRALAASEARSRPAAKVASGPDLHRMKTSTTLCSVASEPAERGGFMVGSGDGHLLSGRVLAVLKLACAGPRTAPAPRMAVFAAR